MGNKINRAVLVALTLGLSFAAQGAIIYNNGLPDQVAGNNMSEFLVAENFRLSANAEINNIRFWSIQSSVSDYLGSIYWAIHSEAAGEPGAILRGGVTSAVPAVATGNSTGFGYAEYVFNIPVNFQLSTGDYWLALHNGPRANVSFNDMLWETTAIRIGSEALYFDPGFGWIGTGNELAFRFDGNVLGGDVPEPGTFALFVGGLAAAAFLRRKA